MKKMFLVALAVSACVCGLAPGSSARQQGARTRRGGLDNLSLPSTTASLAAPSLPEGWQTFEPEGAGFSVAAPAGLEELTRRGRAEGRLAAQFRQYEAEAEGAKYAVGRTGALPSSVADPAQYFALLREVLSAPSGAAGARRGAKMELVRERVVVLDGREGREFEMAGGGRTARAQVFVVEGVVYALGVEGLAASFPEEKAQLFFESFRLTARQ
jgi:hypothetical protein